jgi:hypothetical protein
MEPARAMLLGPGPRRPGCSFGYERSLSSFEMAGQMEIRRGGNDKGN